MAILFNICSFIFSLDVLNALILNDFRLFSKYHYLKIIKKDDNNASLVSEVVRFSIKKY